MISWMQKHRKYLVVTIWISTIAFVGAGFVGWGAYSFTKNSADTIAEVGDRTITGKDLQASYNKIYNYYNQLLGGKLTKEKASEFKIEEIAKAQLIRDSLFLNYADELGITATSEDIVSKIRSVESFKKDGVFDKEIYFKVLKSINKSPSDYESDRKKEIIIDKLSKSLNIPETKLEIETIAATKHLQDKLSIKLIEVNDSDINITKKDLKNYWNNNKENYLSKKSYVVKTIKVLSANMKVNEKDMQEFYNDKKHIFKDDDDKILKFEDAKEDVSKKLKLKYAKKEALKKYLAFKNGKIELADTLTLEEGNSPIPLEKIASAEVGSYIKAIKLDDGYMTAKLTSINEPKPLEFTDAKFMANSDLLNQKKANFIESKAKETLKNLSILEDIGFLTKKDAKKITALNENEAELFLNYIFSKTDKKGYYLFASKAVIYEITDQKIETADTQIDTDEFIQNVKSIKQSLIKENLLNRLRTKYIVKTK